MEDHEERAYGAPWPHADCRMLIAARYFVILGVLASLALALLLFVVVALGVSFFGQVVTWDGSTNLLPLGAFGPLRLGSGHTASASQDPQDVQDPQDQSDPS